MKRLITVMVCLCFISVASAHEETEKIRRLEYTVEELTLKLAERTLENRRLNASIQAALSAQRSGVKVVSGCDVDKIKKAVAFTSGYREKGRAFVAAFKVDGANCTQSQLSVLRGEAESLLYGDDALGLIDYYIK